MGGPGSGPVKTQVVIDAMGVGFDALTKNIKDLGVTVDKTLAAIAADSKKASEAFADLGDTMQKALKKANAGNLRSATESKKLQGTLSDLSESLLKVADSTQKASRAGENNIGVFKNMKWSLSSIIEDMGKLIQIQLRWYGTSHFRHNCRWFSSGSY
jgi:ABC-type transporter Mla subunit MlaD